jgi:neopullulanase
MGRWALSAALVASLIVPFAQAQTFRNRAPEDEVIYFVLPDRFENGDSRNDRGGLAGDRLKTGFDPTDKRFYHGGDLRGLIQRLDYIEALGATALWLGPIYKNKPVQGASGQESAGYHGYWITDFTQVDPHFGTNEELGQLVAAAHARGMKVYLDIVTNHTADVIAYRECPSQGCVYRSRADFPFSRRGGPQGAPINDGFLGDRVQTRENFAKLVRPDFAYTPVVPAAESRIKVPMWLNDPILYHNRGNTTFRGESNTFGDFAGLDDLMTENPRVVQGFIDTYGTWIERFGIDGFRIDTARHVNSEFWQAFVPAMLERAKTRGIANFHIFGEVATHELDPALLARATRVDRLPTVLDFAFRAAALNTLAERKGADHFVKLFDGDALYEGGFNTALRLPTFVSNHDNGRFAHFVRTANANASDDEVLKRTMLAHALMFTLRGVPVVYSGDEQGFAGDGNDIDAREDMFASAVADYNDNVLVGTRATTAQPNFDRNHPLFKSIAKLARIRRDNEALRRGEQLIRNYAETPGLFAVSRIDSRTGKEIVIAFNTSTTPLDRLVEIDPETAAFAPLDGECTPAPTAPGSYRVVLDGLSYVICKGM